MMNPKRVTYSSQASGGFSLVEFMVAIVLGMIIVGGAISVYIATKQSSTETEQIASVSENGRFALQLMSYSLRHAGFFSGASITDVQPDASLAPVTGDCTAQGAAYDTSVALFAARVNNNGDAVFGCVDDAVPNTDVLVIKGVDPTPLYDADPADPDAAVDGVISFPAGAWSAEDVYLVANTESGVIVDGADTPPNVGEGQALAFGVAWPYRLQIFYLRRGDVPTLSRKILSWDSGTGTMGIETQDLVQGVENLRFLFSYDTNNDGEADTHGDLTAVTRWDSVMAMQVFMLLRADTPDTDYLNEKTYTLGDLTLGPFNDNFRRILLQSNLTLRNMRLTIRGSS